MNIGDRLFLLKAGFADPEHPGASFYCPDCMLLHGLLAAYPGRAASLRVDYVDFARPRAVVAELVGDDNQTLPLLVLAEGGERPPHALQHRGTTFVKGRDAIAQALALRHGFPVMHP